MGVGTLTGWAGAGQQLGDMLSAGQEAVEQLEVEALAARVEAPLPGHVVAVQPVVLRLPLLHVAPPQLQGRA